MRKFMLKTDSSPTSDPQIRKDKTRLTVIAGINALTLAEVYKL